MQRIVGVVGAAVDAQLDLACERVDDAPRVEALADRPRVAGLVPDDRRAARLEPSDRVIEPLPDHALQPLVAAGALAAKVLPLAMPPDDAGREQHRAADARPLLAHGDIASELTEPRGRDEPGHARPCD